MYWNILVALGIAEFAIACLHFLSFFGDDKPKSITPRPIFLVNLLAMVPLLIIAVRCGEWLVFKKTVQEFQNVTKASVR